MSHDAASGCCGGSNSKPNNDSFTGSDEKPIELTASAIEAIKNAIKEEGQPGDGLRVSVVGGGCSGYQYNLDFEKEARMGDLALDFGGVTIYVDPVSAGYLKGTVVDFISGLQGTGFKFNNPNAKRTCGCGSSFS
ncbi:MAG: iron-sulfur cluster assembly accessory protein [Deltaproteobacteria bacterium]|nr:iron-sulfur cluster assembly accessory protein [Deltaproteobacteria bacterium]